MAGASPFGSSIANLVISVASAADQFLAWGTNPRARDQQLRAFWPTEAYFASGLFSTVSQYVAFGWSLKGPPRTVQVAQDMLNSVQFGKGPEALLTPFLIDRFTQDNGAFMEIVRTDDDPRAPVVSLNHLDSNRCIRTGRWEEPVIYIDLEGRYHKLKWYNVIEDTEFPAPHEEARGLQYCVLTRMLRAAQIMRDISVIKQEKAAGRFFRQVHLVGGVQRTVIEQAMLQKQGDADAKGMLRYIEPLIIGSLDPTARVTKETIDLASIPDDYDDEKALQVYITLMAMAFGSDYQNFAPLPGGGLGSSTQSKVLNMKSRGKGPALFMKKLERVFNFHGILPRSVTFEFGEQDIAQQMEETELRKARALEREIMIRSGEITNEVARQMAVDSGDLDERYLIMMRESNATGEIVATSTVPAREVNDDDIEPGKPGPDAPPTKPAATAGGNRPNNSNDERNRNPANNQRRSPGGTPEDRARA